MNYIAFKNATLFLETGEIKDPVIGLAHGKIKEISSINERLHLNEMDVKQFDEAVNIVPGFIDLHIHGVENVDAMDGTIGAIEKMSAALPKEGTTAFLPTTMTQSVEEIMKALASIATTMEIKMPGASVLGVHLEGPFISAKHAGAQPKKYMTAPDIELFHHFFCASNRSIKLVTLAPEEDESLQLVKELKQVGVIPAIGHSDATYEHVRRAIDEGACHVTHLFNGMKGLHHREVGIAGASLLHDELKVELIVDGIHLSPETVRIVYRNKGSDGIILVTDAMRAKGLTDGMYHLGGQSVMVKERRAVLNDGTLAGSTLAMNEAIKNMIRFSGCTFREAIQMATENPAKQLQIFDEKGSIKVGKDGDFVVMNDSFQVMETYVLGEKVFG